jgi:ABC-type transporter Mla subunit MlaD
MADYNTLQKRRNMIVGGFVVIAFCFFIWMVALFGELPVAVSQLRSFKVMVNFPNAPGAQENTPVQYCGYQIGKVISVSPPFLFRDEQGRTYHQVKVTLAIEKRYIDIPSNVDIKLMKRGLGSSYIEFVVDPAKPLTPMDPERPETAYLVNGMVLQGSAGMSSEFFPLEVQDKIEALVDSVATLAGNINDIIGDRENQVNIKQTIANITTMTGQATETFKSIKDFSDAGTEAVQGTAEQLDGILAELRVILDKIDNGDGTAGRLINDGRLYENLLDSSEELRMALEQLRNLATEAREKGIKLKW